MGNSHESTDQIDTYIHPRLGSIKRIQEPNKNQLLGYELVLQNQKVYQDWVKELRYITKEEAVDQIIFLPIDHNFKQTTYCGTGGLAVLRYQDYLYSLAPEIKNRRQIKRPFNQQQLLYLFYNLIKGEALMEGLNRTIGDIKPENIVVNQDGYVKIISQFSWPGQPIKSISGWEKGADRQFLAPEQCEERQKRRDMLAQNIHFNQSEVFSIGMTVLEAGTLRDCAEIYGHTSQYRFNQVKVREFLDIFESRYSKQFAVLVKEMLHPNPRKRWKAERIYQILKPWQYQILNLEEILIKINQQEYIPRIEREEKISIKKIGDSHHSQNDFSYETGKFGQSEHQLRFSLNNPHIYNSNAHLYGHQGHPSGLHQSKQHPHIKEQNNYQLVNEYSNFGRQQHLPPIYNPPPPSRHSLQPRHMVQSLPPNLLQYEQMKRSATPQYVTQNSMMPTFNRPLLQSNHELHKSYTGHSNFP